MISDRQDDWKRERDERLARLGIGRQEPEGDAICIHCGRAFWQARSTGGCVGVCQECVDD